MKQNISQQSFQAVSLIPHQASTMAGQVDAITIGLLLFCGVILTFVFGLIILFSIKYRKNSPSSRVISLAGENLLEWGWTLATLVIFIGIFIWGSVPFLRMHVAPADAAEIMVVGKQWMWKFQHPNGVRELNDLHVPVGKPIVLVMTSEDVIHSFFVPDFRIKQDVLPARYTRVWFEASRPGEYHLFCTQYCGTMHAAMLGRIIALEASDYEKWLETGVGHSSNQQLTMASRGARLFTNLGCMSCHGVNPGARAPSLTGIFGRAVSLSEGSTVIADENYLRESILNPNAKIVQGYQAVMPSYTGLASEEDVLDLIAYVKALDGTPKGEEPAGPSAGGAIPEPPPTHTSKPQAEGSK